MEEGTEGTQVENLHVFLRREKLANPRDSLEIKTTNRLSYMIHMVYMYIYIYKLKIVIMI